MEEEKKKNAEFVGVDEKYIPEEEKYVDDSVIGNNKTAKKLALGYIFFIVIFGVLVFAMIIYGFFNVFRFSKVFSKEFNENANNARNIAQSTQEQYENMKNDINSKMDEQESKRKTSSHNSTLQNSYSGTQSGFNVRNALNEVIRINQQDDVKITVVYNGTSTQDASQIGSLTGNFKNSTNYLIVYDYDSEGFIVTMNISNV